MTASDALARNIPLYRWSRFLRSLIFWQAIWFLYFQQTLSAAEAILLYVIYDLATLLLEVPSGYLSDRLGRKMTLLTSAITGLCAAILLVLGDSFAAFALANGLLGASMAFASGTDEAMLFESLKSLGRAEEVERQEVIAWRWSFTALAVSAILGGALGMVDLWLPYLGVVAAYAALVWVTLRFTEPARRTDLDEGGELLRLSRLAGTFRNPVLVWMFALGTLMYGFSHLPFIFGQPFILSALDALGLGSTAPVISGAVSATMMAISVAVSLVALPLRRALGLPALLLCAFGLQIAISGAMALTDSLFVVAILLLRMVPDALSRPFILGRVQPLLDDDSRATWLSLQSLSGRLVFATAMTAGAVSTTDAGQMPYADIRAILTVATLLGIAALLTLALTARRISVDGPRN